MSETYDDNEPYDDYEIRRALAVVCFHDELVEMRAMNVQRCDVKSRMTISGYFDKSHRSELVEEATDLSGSAPGIFVTLNPVKSDALGRAANRIENFAKNTTCDEEIVKRCWLFIDLDPTRPSGVSATESEHEAALEKARECKRSLAEQGWPEPVVADSGNGCHLLYRADLPNDADSTELVKAVLNWLAGEFDDESVEVDKTTYNAARIIKLYGTLSAKGDSVPGRPYRISRILEAPKQIEVVTEAQMRRLISDDSTAELVQATTSSSGFDLESWLKEQKLGVQKSKSWNGGTLYELASCPWRPEETDGGAWVGIDGSGNVTAKCHHSKCAEKGWSDLHDSLDPNCPGNESPDDPHRLARTFLDEHFDHTDGRRLQFWNGEWYEWKEGAWVPFSEPEMRALFNRHIKNEFDNICRQARERGDTNTTRRKVISSTVTNATRALESEVLLREINQPPCWLAEPESWPAEEVLVARNGMCHMPSFLAQKDYRQSLTPRFFTHNTIDYDFDPDAESPTHWLKFLSQLWPDDSESIRALQQWFGYLLLPDTRQQKILILLGLKRSGKGTIGRVLNRLVGENNVAGPTLSSMTTQFGLQPLIGKSVAIIPDARLDGRSNSVVVERLLSISGEDRLTIDRKHRSSVTMKLPTRIVILTNELPRFKDSSSALAGRMIFLPMKQSFYGKEDPHLTDRLIKELTGILGWAIEGWKMLRDHGRLLEPESGKALRREQELLGSPVSAFVEDVCQIDSKKKVLATELYGAFPRGLRLDRQL